MTQLKFTPLEFETFYARNSALFKRRLKFTPLEFETHSFRLVAPKFGVKIYSVGV